MAQRQCHNFDDASWALLCHHFQSDSLSPAALSTGSICLWRASELTVYSIEVFDDRVTLWDWAHNCRLLLPMLKVIGHLLRFKIPFFSCLIGIILFCLPHRCHRISGTRWGDYPVHLSQDENQVNSFLNIKLTPFACLYSNVGQNQNIQLFVYTNSTSPLGRNRINI